MLTDEQKEEIQREVSRILNRLPSLGLQPEVEPSWLRQMPPEIRESFPRPLPRTGKIAPLKAVQEGVPLQASRTQLLEPLVRVVARAVEVLGTSEKALRWLNAPVRSLGDQTPASLLGSPEGIALVEDALGSIEHGVW